MEKDRESKVKDGNYICIQSFMVKELKLKGNELLVYAIIFGFCQEENQRFTGSLQYLADWMNCSKQGVVKNLNNLVNRGLIVKEDKYINGVKFCEYYTTEFNRVYNRVEQGIKHSLTNNIEDNINNNIVLSTIRLYNSICVDMPRAFEYDSLNEMIVRNKDYDFKTLFEIAQKSDFLTGRNGEWQANCEWLIRNRNKVMSGFYDNREKPKKKRSDASYDIEELMKIK